MKINEFEKKLLKPVTKVETIRVPPDHIIIKVSPEVFINIANAIITYKWSPTFVFKCDNKYYVFYDKFAIWTEVVGE